MTDIVPAPDIRLSSEFPTNADRAAGVFNTKSAGWADTSRVMASDMDSAAKATHANAIAAQERAQAAEGSAGDAANQVTAAAAEVAAATAQANAAAGFRDQASTSASTASTKAAEASTSAATASTKASQAATSESNAAASAATATSEANRAQAAADSISSGPVTSVNGKTGVVVLAPTDIAAAATQAEMEAGTQSAIRMVSPLRVAQAISALGGSSIIRSVRTTNVQLVKADKGKLIVFGAGSSFAQTFESASTLGDGWWVYIQNTSQTGINLDPFGSQTIDGLGTFYCYPGEVRIVYSDGVVLRSIVLNSFYYIATDSTAFLKPPGYKKFIGDLWGGGASGGKSTSGEALGGGGGAWAPIDIPEASFPPAASIIIAASAPGATSNGTGPTAGNSSSFGGVVAPGGSIVLNAGGDSGFADGVGNPAAIGAGRSLRPRAGGGGAGFSASSNATAAGGASIYGGAGGANGDTTSGANGVAPGGGGGATRTGSKAGDGARGELRLWGIF